MPRADAFVTLARTGQPVAEGEREMEMTPEVSGDYWSAVDGERRSDNDRRIDET